MKEITFKSQRSIFHYGADVVCITTNGFNKKNGEAVMGRGIAGYVKQKDPIVAKKLGTANKNNWQKPQIIRDYNGKLLLASFPVKPQLGLPENLLPKYQGKNFSSPIRGMVPGWACKAELEIIEKSAKYLVQMADEHNWKQIMIPAPGCGNGGLKYSEVKKILETILDDRFYICFLKR